MLASAVLVIVTKLREVHGDAAVAGVPLDGAQLAGASTVVGTRPFALADVAFESTEPLLGDFIDGVELPVSGSVCVRVCVCLL